MVSKFDVVLDRLAKFCSLLLVLIILVPGIYVGYRLLKNEFFPKASKTEVASVNALTGEVGQKSELERL